MALTQSDRTIEVTSPLGADVLLLNRMTATEGLGRLFTYELDLLSTDENVQGRDLLGQGMTVRLDLPEGEARHFHGLVTRFRHAGSADPYSAYQVTLRPWLWFLTRTSDCRIFQKMTVPAIIKKVFRDAGFSDFDDVLGETYRTWDYCVQYRETSFNFISRLMEQEGIYYFFRHEEGLHTMVLADAPTAHEPYAGYEDIPFYPPAGDAMREQDHISHWTYTQEVHPGTCVLDDYDFTRPKAELQVTLSDPREHERAEGEIYDYPGEYLETADGDHYVKARLQELLAQHEVVEGMGNARGLSVGSTFELREHPIDEQNREVLIVSATYELENNLFESGAGGSGETFTCSFRAMDAAQNFRPKRVTPKPLVQGVQTAVVTGGSGPTLTDEYGRIKVQFHWDREGKNDQDSSCWVRVSQNWAGKNWGGMFLPHVGQEVIVDFLEGDPDRPIVTGRVYNQDNMPPLTLPDNQLKSIIRDQFGNEIILDGTEGEEHLSLHSPHFYSMVQIGRSMRTFTRSTSASFSFDSKSYHFGSKQLYVKGRAFSLFHGLWGSIKLGAGGSVTIGADLSVGLGLKGSFFGGGSVSGSASWSFSFGYSRDFKYTKGDYKRKSSSDVVVDSDKTVFITGGSNDNTMLQSDNTKISLSFDDSASNRDTGAIDAKSKAWAATAAGLFAAGAGLSAWGYQFDGNRTAETLSADGKTVNMDADYEQINGITTSDIGVMAGLVLGGISSIMAIKGSDITNPGHTSPSSKIHLEKDFLEVFAGQDKESRIGLHKDGGIFLVSKKGPIVIEAKDSKILYKAKADIVMSDAAKLLIKIKIDHQNFKVL